MLCMLFVLIFIVFMYYFTCISFAIRPSGRKSAIKLIDWLRDMMGLLRKSSRKYSISLLISAWVFISRSNDFAQIYGDTSTRNITIADKSRSAT